MLLAKLVPAVLLALSVVPAAQAQAASEEGVVCSGGEFQFGFTPGLSFTPTAQTVTGQLTATDCQHSEISAAHLTLLGHGTGACLPSLGVPAATGSGVITWSNGRQSRYRGTFALTASGLVLGGVVGDGAFRGQSLRVGGHVNPGDIARGAVACVTGGLKDLSGTTDTLAVSE